MPDLPDLEFDQLKNPGDARSTHRRTTAINQNFNALIQRVMLDSTMRLGDALPNRPDRTGPQLHERTQASLEADRLARATLDLAGMTEDALPWQQWVRDLKNRQAAAEETFVQNHDMAENADAYGGDADEYEYSAWAAYCDVEAFKAAIADINAKLPAPNRAARRATAKASGSSGSTPSPTE